MILSGKIRVSVAYGKFYMLIISTCIVTGWSQQLRPLTIKDKHQVQSNITGRDWDQLNELIRLRTYSPSMAGYYDEQINKIYDQYRFSLVGLDVLREDNAWRSDQQNILSAQTFGETLPPTQKDITLLQQNQLQGGQPKQTTQQHRIADLAKILTEVSAINRNFHKTGHYESEFFINDYAVYQDIFSQLKDMLTGNKKISLAEAMYLVESAYGNLHLTYVEYTTTINRSAAFMKQWMKENSFDLNNSEAVHYSIQKFMGETMTIQNNIIPGVGTLSHSHQPFIYDYIDFRGVEDYRNYFLTKTLATGSGQCNTLPRVYLVLAEAMGVKTYLSFAPNHSFIKYKNNNGTIQNYETTVHWHLTNQDYMADMPITLTAIKNHLYLDTLNTNQIIASLMVDLATTFMREHWLYDGSFVNNCIDYSLQYNLNSEGLLLKNLVIASQLENALTKAGITELNKIEPNTKPEELLKAYQENETQLESLGIQAFPDEKYNALLEKHDQRGRLQEAHGVDTKTKKSLFFDE